MNSPTPNIEPDALNAAVNGRVLVAMSGGVDSSVVAAMMHRDGLDVVGVSMRLYADPRGAGRSCCSPDDLLDAREVASEAGFPFYVVNYQEEFQRQVVDYFVDEYRRGRTPSPCVMCNDHLKFDLLLTRMRALDANVLATGHYARIERVSDDVGHRFALLRGVDRIKDQSYFLFGLPREALSCIRLPLGNLTKPDVRALALELGVPTALKAESQDICFVGTRHYSEIVEQRLENDERRPGRFVRATTGAVLGTHDGIHRFTVGQRRGLGIADERPLYVRRIDATTGDVEVGTLDEVRADHFTVERCNWLRWSAPPTEFSATVQVRYRHRGVSGKVTLVTHDDSRTSVRLDVPEAGIAPGQAVVFYDGDEVLGGGWIEEVS